jgi:hypothetical protein
VPALAGPFGIDKTGSILPLAIGKCVRVTG